MDQMISMADDTPDLVGQTCDRMVELRSSCNEVLVLTLDLVIRTQLNIQFMTQLSIGEEGR